MTCNNMARLRALLRFFSRTARHNPQMWILPVPNRVPHRSSRRFATLGGKYAWHTPMSATVSPTAPSPRAALSRAEAKQQARRKEWSDTLGNISAVIPAKLTKPAGDVRYAVLILHGNFQLLPQILLVQKHRRSRRDMDPAVVKLRASRGRDT